VAGEARLQRTARSSKLLSIFEAAVVVPTLGGLVYAIAQNGGSKIRDDLPQLLAWVLIIGLVELIPVPVWRGIHIGLGFPLMMVVAFLYSPEAAAAAALLAASDPREFKHEVGVLRALFNRCQVALAVGSASLIFHALVPSVEDSQWWLLFGAAALASIADYVVNTTLVCIAASIHFWMSPFRVIRELKVGRLSEYLISYLGLSVFGVILAKVFTYGPEVRDINWWIVPVCILPLLLARQMFFRSKALEEAHKVLQDREHVLRALSNRMAEERRDERMEIAAFLHDDLAQLLFRLSIQVDVARRHLEAGKIEQTEDLLLEIKETKNRTSDRVRALIRDLHRSPLGRAGLGEAIRSFLVDVSRDDVQLHADIDEVDVPGPIALLLYHNAREGVMNALRHASASNIWISVEQQGDEVEMVLRDDGVGFDVEAPGPEGHYGMTMMRERATVGGGTFSVESVLGRGTTITIRFPTSWFLEEESQDQAESQAPPSLPPAGASHGAVATPPPSSTESIPA
jgi:signal transduction histidine kinase